MRSCARLFLILLATIPAMLVAPAAAGEPKENPMLADVLENLDLERPELAKVKDAPDSAPKALALRDYLRARTSFRHPVARTKDTPKPEQPPVPEKLQAAEDALRNILIASPHYPPREFGAKIDWHRNPTKDGEWLWQLHRMSSWNALAEAYANTRDEKYAAAWARQFESWCDACLVPKKPGHAWRTIEAGIRGNAWIGLYRRFVDSEAFTPGTCTRFLAACLEHARYLDAALKKNPSGNNWRLMEAEGLGAIALCFPEFKDAATWRARSFKTLKDNLARQVRADGMHYEQCFNYHSGCIRWFARTAQLAKMNGFEKDFGADYFEKIEAMCAALTKMSFPNGEIPQFGDGHSAQKVHGTLAEWADFFKRQDFAFFGSGGKAGAPPAETAAMLKESGFYALRSGWDADAVCLVLKCGPDGGWHCQPDNGTFELFAGGRRLTPDSGTYIYHGDAQGRAWFRQTRVHQTLTLGGKDTAYRPSLKLWKPGQDLDALVVENAGYKDGTHRRAVLFVKPAFFVIVDEAAGKAAGETRAHFQFAPCEAVMDAKALRAHTGFAEGVNLLVAAMPAAGVTLEEEKGQVSFKYATREPRPAFAFVARKEAGETRRFVTVLVPYQGEAPEVSVAPVDGTKPGSLRNEFDVTVGKEKVRVGYDLKEEKAWRTP